jgi:D-arabinose 5-phosphate isomerase GutQ
LVTTGLGDALVMAIAVSLGFTQEDYSRYHPGGAIGQQLLGKDAM